MKNHIFSGNGILIALITVMLLAGAFTLSLTTCSNATGGTGSVTYSSNASGTEYKLTVTNEVSRAAYKPGKGDSYTFKAGSETSSGTVDSFNGWTYTLEPAVSGTQFYVTVAGNKITYISGTISLNGGSTVTGPGITDDGSNADGSAANPFIIYDHVTLGYMGRTSNPAPYTTWTPAAHYVQITDITVPIIIAGVSNWMPIGQSGNSSTYFTGSFDGGGFKITNLLFSQTINTNYVGLIGYLNTNGVVKNVKLVNCDITGYSYVGGIAGYVAYGDTKIENCSTTGIVKATHATDSRVGGVVGDNRGTVKGCYSLAAVTGTGSTGGVVGYNPGGTVENCYSTGGINGTNCAGGVVGNNDSYTSRIVNCYSSGDVNGASEVGGVTGKNVGTVENSHATGSVNNSGDHAGGIAGTNSGTIRKCYATGNLSCGMGYNGGVSGTNSGMIEYCYYTGNINNTSTGRNGGVAGTSSGTVQYCYSTGKVTSTSANGENGGIVGNNSGTIQYCYSTGDVTNDVPGTDSNGGIVGANTTTSSTVRYCFATGTITASGDRIGGIGGSYAGVFQNNVALNPDIVSTSTTAYGNLGIGRVGGLKWSDINLNVSNNYGRGDMSISLSTASAYTLQGLDGTNVSATQAVTASWWTGTAKWSTSIWNISNGKLPTLKNMPGRTQDPQL